MANHTTSRTRAADARFEKVAENRRLDEGVDVVHTGYLHAGSRQLDRVSARAAAEGGQQDLFLIGERERKPFPSFLEWPQ